MAEHCGIDYTPEMLDVPQESSSLASDDPDLRGLRSDVAEAWRTGGLSASEVALCETRRRRRHGAARLRCSDAATAKSARARGWYALLAPKLVLAAVMNVRTIGNPITAARRRFRLAEGANVPGLWYPRRVRVRKCGFYP